MPGSNGRPPACKARAAVAVAPPFIAQTARRAMNRAWLLRSAAVCQRARRTAPLLLFVQGEPAPPMHAGYSAEPLSRDTRSEHVEAPWKRLFLASLLVALERRERLLVGRCDLVERSDKLRVRYELAPRPDSGRSINPRA